MPTADYRCRECGQTFEHSDPDLPPVIDRTHDINPFQRMLCHGRRLDRVWAPVNIGRVPGAGGSPAR